MSILLAIEKKNKKKNCGAEKTICREITGKVNSKNSKNRGHMSVLLKDSLYYRHSFT